jgi:thiol:disulfide interchange protein DsbD
MRKLLTLLIAAMLMLTPSITTAAEDSNNSENLVKIRLLAEKTQTNANDEIWIGIEQSIAPHWHTYWQNPGDSGTITRTNWHLPDGFEISDIHWPTPKRLPYGPLMNYGFENNVVLLQKLKLPQNLPNGKITLKADIELLVCKEECIPEYSTYTLTLNGENEDNTAFFEKAVSKLPVKVNWPASFTQTDTSFKLKTTLPDEIANDIKPETLTFYPIDWGLIENAKTQSALLNKNTLSFTQSKGERDYTELENSRFVLTYTNQSGLENSFEITGTPEQTGATNTTPGTASTQTPEITLFQALAFAIFGGLILNLMPCVFPVLSIKALSLVKIADKHPNLAKMHGLSYTAGVILSFLVIAGALLILKSAGAGIGWGFQLQNPIIVGALAYLLFTMGLNLMGYFEFTNNFGNIGNKLTQGQGLGGSFFTGVLATLVATPCTAPFMAGAIGFALTQTTIVNLAVFAALGFGLALPYLALSFAPALQSVMPKPGAWMNTFKQFLAFPMFAAAIWLVWVISQQAGATGVLQILSGMGLISFGFWLLHIANNKKLLKLLAIASFVASIYLLSIPSNEAEQTTTQIAKAERFGKAFSPEKLETLLNESDNPVFVEMTAAWCITCKVNNRIGINIEPTKKAFADNNVQYLIGDWTNKDAKITKFLNSYGRNGVPIYVFYGARDLETGKRPEAKILPQILTPTTIRNLF